jgi:hypothetical protein
MKKTIYVDSNPLYGNDANSGRSHHSPKATVQGAIATGLKLNDRVAFRAGQLFTGPHATKEGAYTLKTNGVVYTSYALGNEPYDAPRFVYPSVKMLPTGFKSQIFGVLGDGNIFDGLDFMGADIHLQVFQTHKHNIVMNCRFYDFGFGIQDKASHTIIEDCFFSGGHMLRDGGDDAAGASAIVLERYKDFPHIGTRIRGVYAELCLAPSIRFKPFDGSVIEISGGIEDAEIKSVIGNDIKILAEIGAQAALDHTVRNVLFSHCLAVNSIKGLVFFNSPSGIFATNLEGVRFVENTVAGSDDGVSPVFFSGDYGDLRNKVSFDSNIIVGGSTIYGTDKNGGTDLSTLTRSNNLYWRPDGNPDVGVPLINGDRFEDPRFVNDEAYDYRLGAQHWSDGRIGARGRDLFPSERTRLHRPARSVPHANTMAGGHHIVESWADMHEIDDTLRRAGMTCEVRNIGQRYRLSRNRKTWLKVQ